LAPQIGRNVLNGKISLTSRTIVSSSGGGEAPGDSDLEAAMKAICRTRTGCGPSHFSRALLILFRHDNGAVTVRCPAAEPFPIVSGAAAT